MSTLLVYGDSQTAADGFVLLEESLDEKKETSYEGNGQKDRTSGLKRIDKSIITCNDLHCYHLLI